MKSNLCTETYILIVGKDICLEKVHLIGLSLYLACGVFVYDNHFRDTYIWFLLGIFCGFDEQGNYIRYISTFGFERLRRADVTRVMVLVTYKKVKDSFL